MMAATHLDTSLRCVKYLLCAVNFMFVLTGSMIVSVGTTIYAVYDDFYHFLDSAYCSPATLLIILGAFIFLIAFLGFWGALKESTCMVLVFASSLSLVLILEVVAGISAYALQGPIVNVISDKINYTMQFYDTDKDARNAVDFLQSRLKCCGNQGPNDWRNIFDSEHEPMDPPMSCCAWPLGSLNFTSCETESLYKYGCIDKLALVVNRSALYLASGATAIALIQLTCIMFAIVLGRAIRRHKTERERRRWMLRENLLNSYEPLGKADPFSTFPVVYMQTNSELVEKPKTTS